MTSTTIPTPTTAASAPRHQMAAAALRRHMAAAAATLFTIAALAACGHTTSTTAASRPPAPSSTSGPAGVYPVSVTTVDGTQVSVPGAVPTAVLFFSQTCGACVGGGKSLAQAHAAAQQSGDKSAFLAVDMVPAETAQDVTAFRGQIGAPNLPAALDPGATLSGRYQISAPTTVIVVDPGGTVTYRAVAPSADQITTALHQAATR